MIHDIKIKRIYEPVDPSDGYRVYIDRLWPRGLSHSSFHCDVWEKGIAPSTELREWFHADPTNRWQEFEKKYAAELKANPAFQQLEADLINQSDITLLYSSHDTEHNNAVVLLNLLKADIH
ncbi:MAG: DUF488 family protein [Bacteroides sp.]|nr:DUF488 family protein [Bacteroides sp.]